MIKKYVVYGLRLKTEDTYRYIGITTANAKARLSGHFSSAKHGSKYPVHCWIRKYGRELVVQDIVEECAIGDLQNLCNREVYWISFYKSQGHRLLNLADGGAGVAGYPSYWKGRKLPPHRIEALRNANLGVPHTDDHKKNIQDGVRKHFDTHRQKSVHEYWIDKYGQEVADQMKQEWFNRRSASLSGAGNPMYGRTGENAPNYGRVGELHPMYGTHHSDEAKKKISDSTKGVPKPLATRVRMSYANHKRYHLDKGIVTEKCKWCQGADLETEIKRATSGDME